MEKKIIFLDNASSTKPYEEVLSTYLEVNKQYYGNASSIHNFGLLSSRLILKAKEQIIALLGLNSKDYEVIFTSGATEANNLAIKGIAKEYKNRGNHLITSLVEHPSVLECFKELENEGFEVTYLKPDVNGIISPLSLKEAMNDKTILVSIMATNNEVGAVNDIQAFKDIVKDCPKCYFHSDIVQNVAKIKTNYNGVDLLTLTAHKIHGLKGTGCLIKKKNINLHPVNLGGGQEDGNRSGTYDTAGIVSFAKALRLSMESLEVNFNKVKELAKRLESFFLEHQEDYELNSQVDTNPYIVNVSLKNKKSAVIVEGLSRMGIMVSSISACHSKGEKISYVVKAMKDDDNLAHNTLRISLSFENTVEEVDYLLENLHKLVREIR